MMRSFLSLGSIFAIALSLASCNSKDRASDDNFRIAINNNLKRRGCEAIEIPRAFDSWEHKAFPIRVILNRSNDSVGQLDALVKAGILNVVEKQLTHQEVYGFPGFPEERKKLIPVKLYELSALGQKEVSETSKKPRNISSSYPLCIGLPQVKEIKNFTKPSSVFGHTVSEVSYTTKMVNVPAWAKVPEVRSAFNLERYEGDWANTDELVLTNNGWVDDRGGL